MALVQRVEERTTVDGADAATCIRVCGVAAVDVRAR